MMRKTVVFLATLVFCISWADAFAVPSVRQLGTGVSTSTEKTVSVLPSLPKANPETARTVKAQVTKETENAARMPVANVIKNISSIKQPTISGGGQAGISGVSDSAFNDVIRRVQALEAESNDAITGVNESGTGNYVSAVSVGSNNKLNVERTRLLYAPVRNEGSNTIVSDAEIWLVR